MDLINKYNFYKRCLYVLFALNTFFIVFGAIALTKYLETHDMTSLNLLIVGVGTLLFGIILPGIMFNRISNQAKKIRVQTEQIVAQWMTHWIESFKEHDDGMKDVYFWMNMALVGVEILGEHTNHPAARIMGEFAPIMRHELNKNKPLKKSRTHKKTA